MLASSVRFTRPLAGGLAACGVSAGLVSTTVKCDDKDPPHPPRYPFWVGQESKREDVIWFEDIATGNQAARVCYQIT
eukprot:1000578-Amphidinium_carterae.1